MTAAPSPADVRHLLTTVLADLVEMRIEPTALAVIARATDRTLDPAMIKAVADVAEDAAAVLRGTGLEAQ